MALLKWSILSFTAILQSLLIKRAFCQMEPYPTDDSDLATFTSRPDLKPPLFNVTNFNPGRVSPGYWFLAPYSGLHETNSRAFQPAQIGPHIYDDQGTLIWSGASIFHPNTSLDFKVTSYNSSPHLSFIIQQGYSDSKPSFQNREGLILDKSYTARAKVHEYSNDINIDMHEFNVINHGQSALLIFGGITNSSNMDCNTTCSEEMPIKINQQIGFREVDIDSGQILFEWRTQDHVKLWESTVNLESDYFHMNSVDKNSEGDFLISSRNTNCIYKVSGIDGSIIWRLGGKNSSFILDGFNFSSQHDARFREENTTTTIISFLNNASDGINSSANYSSAMFVALHTSTSPMTASLIARYDRPDRQLTELRGNVQILPNTNIVVGWSANGYVSEFTSDGKCILEASFTSMRFATYRAYKFNFTASPTELPSLKAYAFGVSPATISTTYYVSWNGATEIAFWNFYARKDPSSELEIVGKVAKSDFETMFTFAGYAPYVMAEAVAADGKILGHSITEETIVPIDSNFTKDVKSTLASLVLTPSSGENQDDNRPLNEEGLFIENWFINLRKLLLDNWVFSLSLSVACLIIVFLLYILYIKSYREAFSYTLL